jgi:DNA segregation ATPase FtsK/SpoIIIE, S-DNA-T family
MPEPSLTSRERALLDTLVPLVTDRAKRDSDLSNRLRDQTIDAERDYQDAARLAEAAAAAAIRSAEQMREDKVTALKDAFDAEYRVAESAMNAELATFGERTQSIENAAQQDMDDSGWLAETVVESSERKLKNDFTNLARQIAAYTSDIDQVKREADALLAKQGHPALKEFPEPVPGASLGGEPTSTKQACELARADVIRHFASLAKHVRPPILKLSGRMGTAAVLAVIGAGAGGLAVLPTAAQNIAIGAAAGAITGVIGTSIFGTLSRRRVPQASALLGEAIARAVALGSTWLEESEAERDRQAANIREKRDAEIRKAKDRFAAIRKELHRRRHEEEPAIRQRHESVLAAIRRRYELGVRGADDERRRHLDAAQAKREMEIRQAQARKQDRIVQARSAEESGRKTLLADWTQGVRHALAQRDLMADAVGRHNLAWMDAGWSGFRPSSVVPSAIRFGEIEVDASTIPGGLSGDVPLAKELLPLSLPLMLDLHDKGSLLFQSGPEGRPQIHRAVSNILLRLLTAFPPGKVRFTFIDPVGLGQSFAGFMHLADYEEAIVGDKIWTDAKRIEQKLVDLTDHMENVIQKYLRNEFATIHDYNQQAGEVAEPFRFLVLADFPAGLSEQAAKRLASIITSGARCGVYTIIMADSRQRPPHWLPMQEIEAASLAFTHAQGRFACKEAALSRWPISFDPPPSEEQFNTLIHAIGRFAKDSSKVQVPFEIVAPPAGQYWSGDCSEELKVPLGRAGANKLQYMSLGRGTSQHVLIAGRTGSGKSTLLHAIVTNLSLWYRPEEVEFYLVDFKKGVEFKTYATHQVPHARVVAVESEREFGLSVLRRLDAELTRRGNLFRDAGVQDLAAYRKWSRGPGLGQGPTLMPRTLLIVDEFQEFFVEDDKLAQEASLLLDRLVRQGRAFGIHVILGSQTVGGAYSLARSTIGQMAIRIALQSSEADSYLIMAEDNNAARLLNRPGEAIYNDASGMVEGNSPFQIVWLPEHKREKYLMIVQDLAEKLATGLPPPPIVFEGNIPSDLAGNAELTAVLEGRIVPSASAMPKVYLGDPISIKDPTAVTFRRQSGGNLLIVGQQEYPAQAIEVASILAALAFAPATRVHILNAPNTEDGGPDPFVTLAQRLDSAVHLRPPRDVDALMAELSDELERRRSGDSADHGARFLVVHGLHRHRGLRKNEDDFSFGGEGEKATRPDQQFAKLLREGPPVGMHVIAWCDTVSNLERTLDRRGIREFDFRVPFQMSSNDSTALIDTPQAVNLGRHRALLFSEELGQVEKFRPYSLPDPAWLDKALASIKVRLVK